VKLKNIVVAVDGSDASQEALNYAVVLALQNNSSLKGFFIIDRGWSDYIGNDWQSTQNARQGFLDYIQTEQEQQAEAARQQFESAVDGIEVCNFMVLGGEPIEMLISTANAADTDLFITGKRIFQVSGRPSLRDLGRRLAAKSTRPLMLFP